MQERCRHIPLGANQLAYDVAGRRLLGEGESAIYFPADSSRHRHYRTNRLLASIICKEHRAYPPAAGPSWSLFCFLVAVWQIAVINGG